MPFTIEKLPIEGLAIVQPKAFFDDRGFFLETFSEQALREAGIDTRFVQDNLSYSKRGTVRGLHFQAPPHAQAKLVTVFQGAVLDVVVDIRKGSPTYGKSYTIELTDQNKTAFYVPAGFAHGFSVLSDTCIFYYKCSNYYNKPSEGGLLYNDPALGIDWRVAQPIVSDKDKVLPTLSNLNSPF
jgi:dTDP-4-dehydrorhamnose 3,5-epimerase